MIVEVTDEFRRYKRLAEKALAQTSDADLSRPGPGNGNSLATLVWHISGNLTSRFTSFRTTDGEKPWRRRDGEFVDRPVGRDEVLAKWEPAWGMLFGELARLTEADLAATVRIRGEAMTIAVALQRALAHIAYHVGQIVYVAKALRGDAWDTLSIPIGQSDAVNRALGYEAPAERISMTSIAPTSAEAQALIAELDAELIARYPGLPTHGLRDRDLASPLTVFLIGRLNGEAVACGATRAVEPAVAEIKRMYVRPTARGRGFGQQILAALESHARESGVTRLVLETGDRQPEAISLYKAAGFAPIPAYGAFKDNPISRCFGKSL